MDVLIEDFWTCDQAALESGGYLVKIIKIVEPRFGMVKRWKSCYYGQGCSGEWDKRSTGPMAFRVAVPYVYALNSDAPVTLRLFLLRCLNSSCAGDPPDNYSWDNDDPALRFSIIGKRMLGTGSARLDFGVPRTIKVVDMPAGQMRVIDLPLGSDGLGCPEDLSAGDFLAFEMDTLASNAVYRLLQAEIFSSEDAVLVNATVE